MNDNGVPEGPFIEEDSPNGAKQTFLLKTMLRDAKKLQENKFYPEAKHLYQKAISSSSQPLSPNILYDLALCHVRLGETLESIFVRNDHNWESSSFRE